MCSSGETFSCCVSDSPGCRPHPWAAGEKGQEKPIWRGHYGEKMRNTLTLLISKEGKGDPKADVCVRARVWRVDSSYLDICSILKKLQFERKEVVWTFHLLSEFYEEEFWRISTFLKQDKILAVTDWSTLSFGIYLAFVKNSISSHSLAFSI